MASVYKLIVAEMDFRVQKLQIVAALVGVKLDIQVVAKDKRGAAASETPQRVLPVLRTPCGAISGSNVIMRYLAGLGEDLELSGFTAFNQSAVDEWIAFSFDTVEPAVSLLPPSPLSSPLPSPALSSPALSSLLLALSALDGHLAARTFLVGDRPTLADVALVAAVAPVFTSVVETAGRTTQFGHLVRWFYTVRHIPQVLEVCGAVPLAGSAGVGAATTAVAAMPAAQPGALPSALTSVDTVLPQAKFTRSRQRISDVLHQGEALVGQSVAVCGWARTTREAGAGKLLFIALNDGTCFDSLQAVAEVGKTEGFEAAVKAGGVHASFRITGTVVKSPAKGQAIEMHATKIDVLGTISDPAEYPLPKGRHTVEYLREIPHLRPRSNLIGAVQRIRNACAYATHRFFQERGFSYVHTPIITGSDCEGAGEMFQVTTLVPDDAAKDLPRTKDGKINYAADFFGKPSFLTVSGQLQVETFAAALSDVYTFGPTFRAELSHTSRHLAEFWMIEPEISFATLEDDMALAEDYLKFCTQFVLDHCGQDLKFFQDQVESGLLARLHNVVAEPFQRLTYTEAIELLTSREHAAAAKFETKPYWGIDLASEHERYLTEKVFKKPVILINYPKDIKAFYMKLNPDGKTVAAMDVLVPKVGEIIGGSQREDDFTKLRTRMAEMHVAEEGLKWYLDLRKYGSVPHAGFGLGFERLVMYVTGLENIRDAIPFPRWPGNALL